MKVTLRRVPRPMSSLPLIAFALYAASFGSLYDAIGGKAGAVSVLPVVLAAWVGGLVPGLIAATCGVLLDLVLYDGAGAPVGAGDAFAYLVLFVAAAAV